MHRFNNSCHIPPTESSIKPWKENDGLEDDEVNDQPAASNKPSPAKSVASSYRPEGEKPNDGPNPFSPKSASMFAKQLFTSKTMSMTGLSILKKRKLLGKDVKITDQMTRNDEAKKFFAKTTVTYTYEKKTKERQTKNAAARTKLKTITNQHTKSKRSNKPPPAKAKPPPAKAKPPIEPKAPKSRTIKEVREVTYCKDIEGLFRYFGKEHQPDEYRMFIDSSVESLIVALLKNQTDPTEPKQPPLIILYSPHCKENRTTIKKCLDLLKYNDHQWLIIG